MEPLDYLRLLRQRWFVVVAALVAAVSLALVTAPRQDVPVVPATRTYTARHTLIRDQSLRADQQQMGLELLALLATTGVIPPRVAERLDDDTPPAILASQVQVVADGKLGTLTITTRNDDGERAAALANAFGAEILEYATEQSEQAREDAIAATTSRVEQQEQRIRQLDQALKAVAADSVDAQLLMAEREALIDEYRIGRQRAEQLSSQLPTAAGLYTLEEATPVPVIEGGFTPPTSTRGRAVAGAALGLALGVALALGLGRIDTRLRTRRGAERAFGLPVVAEVPKLRRRQRRRGEISVNQQPASFAAESYRMLRLALQIMPRWILPVASSLNRARTEQETVIPLEPTRTGDGDARIILVTSAGAAEGKTSTVANLAASFAEVGKVVLAVDCDFRHPELHQHLSVDPGPGSSDFLLQREQYPSLEELVRESSVPGVWVLTSGTARANPGEILAPDQDLLRAAAAIADVVVVDAGPVLAVNDPAALVPGVDAVVVVARAGRTTAEAAHRITEYLARLAAPVLGVALIGVSRGAISPYYHERYTPGSGNGVRRLLPLGRNGGGRFRDALRSGR